MKRQNEELVIRAKRGDAEAFITLIEESRDSLKRVALAYLKNEEDIADAIQDTILDAFEHIPSLKKPEFFKTWLVRILINNCAEIYRKNKRHINFEYSPEEVGGNMEQDAAEHFSMDLEFLDLLRALPDDSRVIFQLYFGEQFTTAEIAGLLKLNESTVKSRIHRGKEQLRKII